MVIFTYQIVGFGLICKNCKYAFEFLYFCSKINGCKDVIIFTKRTGGMYNETF